MEKMCRGRGDFRFIMTKITTHYLKENILAKKKSSENGD